MTKADTTHATNATLMEATECKYTEHNEMSI